MQMFSFSATERGIRQRQSAKLAEQAEQRLRAQREARKAEQAKREAERICEEEAAKERARHRKKVREMGLGYRVIEARALRVFGVTRLELVGGRRSHRIVIARQFIAYWSSRLTRLSLPQIGNFMDRDHTTILHGRDAYPEKRAKMGRYLRRMR